MNHRLLASVLATLSSLTIGCGGGEKITCSDGKDPVTVPGQSFVSIPYAGSGQVCLTRTPETGFTLQGLYEYDDFGTPSEPVVRLWGENDANKSTFQTHGVTEREIEWGIAVHPDGRPIGPQTDHGAITFLFYKYKNDNDASYKCTPGLICDNEGDPVPNAPKKDVWDAAQLSISFDMQKMYIYGERIRACNGTCSRFANYWDDSN